jgi:hypothetical protein
MKVEIAIETCLGVKMDRAFKTHYAVMVKSTVLMIHPTNLIAVSSQTLQDRDHNEE